MPMKKPPHPGGVVMRECIEPLGLTGLLLETPASFIGAVEGRRQTLETEDSTSFGTYPQSALEEFCVGDYPALDTRRDLRYCF
jgi:hypothetical protein